MASLLAIALTKYPTSSVLYSSKQINYLCMLTLGWLWLAGMGCVAICYDDFSEKSKLRLLSNVELG